MVQNNIHNLQREFLYNAIQDTVSTIRAVDTKIHIVLGMYLIPIAVSDKISNASLTWYKLQDWGNLCLLQIIALILLSISILIWIYGLVISIAGIIAISNPVKAINLGNESPKGTFYYVGKLVKKDIFNYKIDAKLDKFIENLPLNEADIIKELSFELMKLGFIRDLKIKRHKLAASAIILWIVAVITVIVLYHLTIPIS